MELRKIAATLIALVGCFNSGPGRAAFLPIYGGPTYDSSTGTGYQNPSLPFPGSSAGSGIAAGNVDSVGNAGRRAVRWDASGTMATVLGTLGANNGGETTTYAINAAGTAVGYAIKYEAGQAMGQRAVRWDASGTAATELGNLGVHSTGGTTSEAFAINGAGTAVGRAFKYENDVWKGELAVRWDASGTAATELGNLGTDSEGRTRSEAFAINEAGTAVGRADKYVAGTYLGWRATRWDVADLAMELGHLGTQIDGVTFSNALSLNDLGMAAGEAAKYAADNYYLGFRAVRWDASGAATELGHLGTDTNGVTESRAYVINYAGTAIGQADKYVAGVNLGVRGVRWDASGTAATELGHLGSSSSPYASSYPYAINDAGTAVGAAFVWDDVGTFVGERAVMWGQDAVAIDLNALIDPASGWVNLSRAYDITNDNWITGIGTFDPDGPGGLDEYDRLFLMHIPNPLPGDYNHDGMVDAADYVAWRRADGTEAGYQVWRSHFGETASDAMSSHAAVAEPASFALGLMFTVAVCCLHTCERRNRFRHYQR